MAIQIDVQELTELLELTPNNQNIMIVGKHGIGKSDIIKTHYEKKGKKVIAFFLGQMSDPGDLIGLMFKNEQTGHSEFMPPYWWPDETESVVLFLDEMNRARPEILQSVMDLTLNRTLAGKQLPKGSIVISAINEGEEYQLTDLDPALVSRFNVYHFLPSVQDWLIWADKKGIDKRIQQFIQKNPTFLDSDDSKSLYKDGFAQSLSKSPDRRAWARVSDFIKPFKELTNFHAKVISGMIGLQAATQFRKSLVSFLKITPEQLLLDFNAHKTALKKLKFNELILLNEQIMIWLNRNETQLLDKALIIKNLELYLNHLKTEKQNEAIAHFASMLEDKKFSNVTGWILIDSSVIMNLFEQFISNINLLN
jgi:hypothetical protein